jgi:hypothetical protein
MRARILSFAGSLSVSWGMARKSSTPALARHFATSLLMVALGREARAAEPTPTGSPAPSCPESEAVWTTVVQLVPSAAAELLAAKPHVEIVDLGDQYRVHVVTDRGALERIYTDPARNCDKRTRFAAEFIVVAVLPPQLLIEAATGPSAAGHASAPIPETIPTPSPPPPITVPVQKPPAPVDRGRNAVLRLEISGVAEASPPILGAPGVLAWGGNLLVRIGAGRFGGVLGVGYLPRVEFDDGNLRAAVTRVPAVAGLSARLIDGAFRLDGAVAAIGAFERYEGVSPHMPSDATRVAPGMELGLTISPRAIASLSPILSLSCAWMPLTEEIVTEPQGNASTTPSIWLGASLGMSLEL